MNPYDIKTGGPAFPVEQHDQDGMTLRDYFAAKAIQGLLADLPKTLYGVDWAANTAKAAYGLADAMLAARSQA